MLSVNPTYSNQKAAVQAYLKFMHPGVKTMLVSGNANFDGAVRNGDFHLKLDVFATTAQSLEVRGVLNSLNLGDRGVNVTSELNVFNKERSLDFAVNQHFAVTDKDFGIGSMLQCRHDPTKSAGFLISANLHQVELLVRSPYGDLVHVNSKLDLNEKYQKIDSEVTTIGVPPMKYTIEASDFNTLKYTAGRQDSPQKYLQFVSSLVLGKAGEVRAEVIDNRNRRDLFHSSVLLDDANFLKTDFGVNTENIKAHLENIRGEAKQAGENLKNTMKTAADDIQARVQRFTDTAKKYVPDFKPLAEDYQKQLNQIKEELLADKSIKEFAEFL
ncbi:uncharacterized protein LOC113367316 [Ctenocephalides felis]|nr:uncharacterized protein LOC113367316 [Ctenocephalides felis]